MPPRPTLKAQRTTHDRPLLWPFPDEDAAPSGHPVRCVKCGRPTWRRLNEFLGVHRGCEEVEEVARL